MPKILILTGAVAAGKNTIAHRYTLSHEKSLKIHFFQVSIHMLFED